MWSEADNHVKVHLHDQLPKQTFWGLIESSETKMVCTGPERSDQGDALGAKSHFQRWSVCMWDLLSILIFRPEPWAMSKIGQNDTTHSSPFAPHLLPGQPLHVRKAPLRCGGSHEGRFCTEQSEAGAFFVLLLICLMWHSVALPLRTPAVTFLSPNPLHFCTPLIYLSGAPVHGQNEHDYYLCFWEGSHCSRKPLCATQYFLHLLSSLARVLIYLVSSLKYSYLY